VSLVNVLVVSEMGNALRWMEAEMVGGKEGEMTIGTASFGEWLYGPWCVGY
jgi:hypothetical protein